MELPNFADMQGDPIWTDPVKFSEKCDEYFRVQEENNKPFLWTGLALYLGFASRQSLWEYGKKEEFSLPVKRALMRIEAGYESNLHQKNSVGSIFALKNFDWKDKQEISQEVKITEPVVTQVEIIHTNGPETTRGQES